MKKLYTVKFTVSREDHPECELTATVPGIEGDRVTDPAIKGMIAELERGLANSAIKSLLRKAGKGK